jgi:hypothetical protein
MSKPYKSELVRDLAWEKKRFDNLLNHYQAAGTALKVQLRDNLAANTEIARLGLALKAAESKARRALDMLDDYRSSCKCDPECGRCQEIRAAVTT